MEPVALSRLVADTALGLGFDLVGVAPAGPSPDLERYQNWLDSGHAGQMDYLVRRVAQRADPRELLPEAGTVIVVAASYFTQDLPKSVRNDPSRGQIAAYAWGEDYHRALKAHLIHLDGAIRQATGRTSLGKAYVDTGPILERSWATQAGLGFIGKNTCLIAPRLGSWLFLGVLLVPELMAYDRPMRPEGDLELGFWSLGSGISNSESASSKSQIAGPNSRPATCGACTRCLETCPTMAFPRPYVLDARRCISYLTIELRGPVPRHLRPLMGNWIFGCDLCQVICPWNKRFSRPARLATFQPRADMAAPQLLDLLALDETAFRARFRRSPVLRAKRQGLLRNVCIALGNWADPSALPGLVTALDDPEPLVRGHAAWALGRIGTPDAVQGLQRRLQLETDPFAVDEIRLALSALIASPRRRQQPA